MKPITIKFHYGLDRFCLGWDCIGADERDDYHTITLYLFMITIDFNYKKTKK